MLPCGIMANQQAPNCCSTCPTADFPFSSPIVPWLGPFLKKGCLKITFCWGARPMSRNKLEQRPEPMLFVLPACLWFKQALSIYPAKPGKSRTQRVGTHLVSPPTWSFALQRCLMMPDLDCRFEARAPGPGKRVARTDSMFASRKSWKRTGNSDLPEPSCQLA